MTKEERDIVAGELLRQLPILESAQVVDDSNLQELTDTYAKALETGGCTLRSSDLVLISKPLYGCYLRIVRTGLTSIKGMFEDLFGRSFGYVILETVSTVVATVHDDLKAYQGTDPEVLALKAELLLQTPTRENIDG